jgi:hypothetical protein
MEFRRDLEQDLEQKIGAGNLFPDRPLLLALLYPKNIELGTCSFS